MAPVIERLINAGLLRLRLRSRAAMARAVRLTGAAVAAFVVAQVLFPATVPILAPLTALLVVEATLKDIVTSGVQRVASVTAGVLLAIAFSSVVGLSWWSLGALIAVSILLGQLLRLGPHLLEVPISAMLVLAAAGAEAAAVDRISETLIGAAVGVAVNVIFPPRVRANTASEAVRRYAGELARAVRSAAGELREPITVTQATRWMDEARSLSRNLPQIDKAVQQAENSRRLNPRALVTPDTSDTLRADLDALEHTTVAVRSMFRSILDGVRDNPTVDPTRGEDLRLVFAALLDDLAATIDAFGDLAGAEGTEHLSETQDEAAAALLTLREARDRIDDLQLIDPGADGNGWELSEPVIQTVERVLRDLDIRERSRRRKQATVPVKVDPLEIIKTAHEMWNAHAPAGRAGRPHKPPHKSGRAAATPKGVRRSPDRREIPADQTGPHRIPLGRTPARQPQRSRQVDSALDTAKLRAATRPSGQGKTRPLPRS